MIGASSTTSRKRRRVAFSLIGLCTLVVVALFGTTETFYYYPLTPLSLDTGGETRLPGAGRRIRLLFVGDILLGDSATATIAAEGYDYPFAATRSLIQNADLAIGNLEGPISTTGKRNPKKRWAYKMKKTAALALSRAGFDLMDLANNHIQDCGDVGIEETIDTLTEAGLLPFGAGLTESQAHRPAIKQIGGITLAFLGYVPTKTRHRGRNLSLRRLACRPGRGGAAWGAADRVKRDIQTARSRADLVFVSFHIGDRYQKQPDGFERRLCQKAIEAGADAVIGHGTHIAGPIELHRGKPIVYALGNFAFGSFNRRARFSLMAFIDIDPDTRSLNTLHALPIYTMNKNPWIRFQSKVVTGLQGRRVLKHLVQMSRPHNPVIALREGPLRLHMKL